MIIALIASFIALLIVFLDKIIERYFPKSSIIQFSEEVDDIMIHMED